MRPLPLRRKLLLGALGVATAAWTVDSLLGRRRPATARAQAAAGAPSAAPQPAPQPAADVEELLRTVARAAPLASLPALRRDPFAPTGVFAAATRPVASRPGAARGPGAARVPFERRHRLDGVLTGPVPLAVIDGEVFGQGSLLDGYVVVRIERQRVVCRRGDARAVLTLGKPRRSPR